MNISTRKSNHIFDYVIVGSGLSGLAIATALSKETQNILLIDGADFPGGHNRAIPTPLGPQNNGLRFLPATELSIKAIDFLSSVIGEKIGFETTENPALTYEDGQVKSFLGFGDQPPAFYDEISYFTAPKTLKPDLDTHEWIQKLIQQYQGEFLLRSHVTKFVTENDRVTQVLVNGQKIVQGTNFIYCGPIKTLKPLLPEGALNFRALQKMSKTKYWTAVCLDLLHAKQVTQETAIHILNGTTHDEVGPCAGLFQEAANLNGENVQYSQWMSFIDDQDAEESENIAAALKKMKKQIKRAYPEALENLKFERILVVPSLIGDGDLKLTGQQTLGSIENLWIGSPSVHPQQNIVGALLQAEMVLAALGFREASVQNQSVSL
ncbi:MAG: NAD(P)-binding protein [Pseudobdellovibrionaceae bacterium]